MANQGTNFGSYVPATSVWDPSQLLEVDVTSPAFKELLVRMYQNLNLMAIVLNTKDSAIYGTQEFVNGQAFFPDPSLSSTSTKTTSARFRNVFRTVVNFGALPNAALKSVPHNIAITSSFTFTRIYGAASDTTGLTYISLPFVDSAGLDNIELEVDMADVNITTVSNRTNYNVTYVILEYLKF
jgi:hypothetical protein